MMRINPRNNASAPNETLRCGAGGEGEVEENTRRYSVISESVTDSTIISKTFIITSTITTTTITTFHQEHRSLFLSSYTDREWRQRPKHTHRQPTDLFTHLSKKQNCITLGLTTSTSTESDTNVATETETFMKPHTTPKQRNEKRL
ncbi:hypothetical protein E2C01_013016 [Portunus trituberculatus]|uniref:Uncharacterized protein n=1 Tax=Portunus trituberculatus TaxID=210409 RepID=A0A5B7DG82_PORTR|nr:hypothetical protein [Portunus trituberculatus]